MKKYENYLSEANEVVAFLAFKENERDKLDLEIIDLNEKLQAIKDECLKVTGEDLEGNV